VDNTRIDYIKAQDISCNDGDQCTINDIFDQDCQCVGTFQDSDGDGVCNDMDICPGGNDLIDSNGNGIPDFCDECKDHYDNNDSPQLVNDIIVSDYIITNGNISSGNSLQFRASQYVRVALGFDARLGRKTVCKIKGPITES